MIKAIIFDCFGVLTNDSWREFLDTLPPGQAVAKARELNHLYDSGKLEFREFIDQVTSVTGGDRKLIEKIFTHPDHTKNLLLLDYIASLRTRYKIGVLSNVNRDWIREEFLTPKEQRLFDAYTFSYKVGATKPHPSMYHASLDQLGVKPGEAVFVDDVERYVDAARELGMSGIVYKNFQQMKRELELLLAAVSDN